MYHLPRDAYIQYSWCIDADGTSWRAEEQTNKALLGEGRTDLKLIPISKHQLFLPLSFHSAQFKQFDHNIMTKASSFPLLGAGGDWVEIPIMNSPPAFLTQKISSYTFCLGRVAYIRPPSHSCVLDILCTCDLCVLCRPSRAVESPFMIYNNICTTNITERCTIPSQLPQPTFSCVRARLKTLGSAKVKFSSLKGIVNPTDIHHGSWGTWLHHSVHWPLNICWKDQQFLHLARSRFQQPAHRPFQLPLLITVATFVSEDSSPFQDQVLAF